MPAGDLLRLASNGLPFSPLDTLAMDLLSGILLAACEAPEIPQLLTRLRQTAGPQGYAIMQSGPRTFLRQVNAWGEPPPYYNLMRNLKQRWDPANILNRYEFIR
jgi:hypothetical protein